MAKRNKTATSLTQRLRMRGRGHGAIVKSVSLAASRELQRDKICRLLNRGWSPSQIHKELQRLYGNKVYSIRTVEYYRRKQLKNQRGEPLPKKGRPVRKIVSEKILTLRASGCKTSVRKTALLIKEPRSTTYDHFRTLEAAIKPIRKEPHKLSDVDKGNRIMIAEEMLKILRDKKCWPYVVTGDESWIFFDNQGTAEWVFPGEQRTLGVKRQQGAKKLMLVVFFNSQKIILADFIPEGTTLDALSFCDILDRLVQQLSAPRSRSVWLHVDNASSHRAKRTSDHLHEIGLSPMPHPAYSPDLAPSDFYLFGRLKNNLLGQIFGTEDELKTAVLDDLHKITGMELRRVFNNWILRLEQCVLNAGEYTE